MRTGIRPAPLGWCCINAAFTSQRHARRSQVRWLGSGLVRTEGCRLAGKTILVQRGAAMFMHLCMLLFTLSYFSPTCQVRVVRFYQGCSPHLILLLLLVLLLLLLLLPPPPPRPPPLLPLPRLPRPLLPCQLLAKLFANFGAQCALLDLNLGPSQLSAHRWTSTWDLPSSVRTAGPQPGTCRAQCAPLDLNLGPSELSARRWTSKARLECQKICQIECQIECEKICQIKCHKICQIECQKICQIEC